MARISEPDVLDPTKLLVLGRCLVENVFLLPAFDAPLCIRGAVRFDWAGPATVRPVDPKCFTVLLALATLRQALPGRADVLVLLHVIAEVRLRVTPLGLGRRRIGLRYQRRDIGRVTLSDRVT